MEGRKYTFSPLLSRSRFNARQSTRDRSCWNDGQLSQGELSYLLLARFSLNDSEAASVERGLLNGVS